MGNKLFVLLFALTISASASSIFAPSPLTPPAGAYVAPGTDVFWEQATFSPTNVSELVFDTITFTPIGGPALTSSAQALLGLTQIWLTDGAANGNVQIGPSTYPQTGNCSFNITNFKCEIGSIANPIGTVVPTSVELAVHSNLKASTPWTQLTVTEQIGWTDLTDSSFHTAIASGNYQIIGNAAASPEPASLFTTFGGFGLLGFTRLKKRR